MSPALWMVDDHLRGEAKNGDIEAILEQRIELSQAIHGMFNDRHFRAGL